MIQRDPRGDELSDIAEEPATPSQSGSGGGGMQREIGARDEEKSATGADPQPTSVKKGDKANQGDEPNLPNRDGGGQADKAPPRRS